METSATTVRHMTKIHAAAVESNHLRDDGATKLADKVLNDEGMSSYLDKHETGLVWSIKRDKRLWENVVHTPASYFPIDQYPRKGEVEIHVIAPRDTDEVWIFQVRTIPDREYPKLAEWVHVRFMMRDTSEKEGHWLTAVEVESLLGGEMLVMSDQWDLGGGYAGDPEGDPPTFMETVLEKAMGDLGIGSYDRAGRCRLAAEVKPSARDSRFMQKQVHDFTWAVETEGLKEAMYRFEG